MALTTSLIKKIYSIFLLSLFSLIYIARPALGAPAHAHHKIHNEINAPQNKCLNEAYNPFDFSVKPRRDPSLPICDKNSDLAAVYARDLLLGRQVTQQDDYSCSETKPCSNGACCPKETGWCNYGPEACGTSGISPNEVCWSNCDAKAECGRYAETEGKECPLNVCCSPFGFCGMTEEFCKVTDDEETSCQSNCDQPSSGSSGGNVQKRVIGYYEAWAHDRKCQGMDFDDIPVGSLTHLMFSFGYVTPGTFQIAPMDDLDPSLFSRITALKKYNKALKVMVALGGWTFNDPGATQTVFHDVASSAENRATFIGNLLSFMRQYAFDGVDFDWEYPGAEDRGGQEDDGENFTKLLEELKDAISEQPIEYVVSFTTPTSYWYLRHFDLKASSEAVDFVNVMSYDLHGVWDADNPIGSTVLAHTNLTEIKLALDLYWRNDVDPSKLNLGFGFYGRSFQLADPSCHMSFCTSFTPIHRDGEIADKFREEPGCQFLGGAKPGPCSKNSGTLSYREIMDVIDKHNLKPYYDEEHQVKWITWDNDPWISYDDADTFEAKIDFANEQGLGGVLIWSVDQDTDDLSALSAIVGSKIALSMKSTVGEDAAYWSDVGARNCYVSGCGEGCTKAGYQGLITQPCGSANFWTREAEDKDSTLCCPIDAMPDKDQCSWRSDAPWCEGRCDNGEVMLEMNKWGDGAYCEDGNKAYCCNTALEKVNECYWSGDGEMCKTHDDNVVDYPLTFSGIFGPDDDPDLDTLNSLKGSSLLSKLEDYDLDDISLYCCPPEDLSRWNDCSWHGKPGSCFDGHCDVNTEVQVAWSNAGGGEYCGARIDRVRMFCCAPPTGETLFLPVPLEELFPSPPTGENIDSNFDLKTDDTWGGAESSADTEEPEDTSFQFYVLASPTEIQTTVDKRDGSHWELFNCKDSISEEPQTVQMVCTDDTEDSNCGNLFKGHGAVGTIIQMPQGQGCGPGKYAVVKHFDVAKNQSLPGHISKRSFALRSSPLTVYDLTFDYDFTRVPRDFGDTQMRVDFSNQEGYWNNVVEGAGNTKKRSLASVGGSHKRWLEEEWRDDLHFGALNSHDLHKRWFGKDALDWLKGLLNVKITKEKRHDYEEDVSAIILQEQWDCGSFHATVDAVATASISLSTSFGFTLITTLGPDMNLDNSFLHFNNEGKIESIFTLDAVARLDWDSKDFNIVELPIPGATFKIPGILTVGPRLDLNARFLAGVSVSGRVEARVNLADWEIRQTYPQQDDYNPQIEDGNKPNRQVNDDDLATPSFNTSITADGYAEAHLMPTLAFGIKFNDVYGIDEATVELVADGWARLQVHSDIVGGDCAFGYRVEAGCKLTAQADIPDVFEWHPSPYTFGELSKTLIPSNEDQEWECLTSGAKRDTIAAGPVRGTGAGSTGLDPIKRNGSTSLLGSGLRKRYVPYGPLISLPKFEQFCPSAVGEATEQKCEDIYAADDLYATSDGSAESDNLSLNTRSTELSKDLLGYLSEDSELADAVSHLEERLVKAKGKSFMICYTKSGSKKTGGQTYWIENWDESGDFTYLDNDKWSDCNNYEFGEQDGPQDVPNKHYTGAASSKAKEFVGYRVEHVLEGNQLDLFMVANKDLCSTMRSTGWFKRQSIDANEQDYPWEYIAKGFPYKNSNDDEFYYVIEFINLAKENIFLGNKVTGEGQMPKLAYTEAKMEEAMKTMKVALMTWKYMNDAGVKNVLKKQVKRVGDRMEEVDQFMDSSMESDWVYVDLRSKWNSFIKANTDVAVTKLKTFLDEWIPRIETVLPADDSQDDQVPGRKERREKVQKLREAIDNMGTWTSPW